MPTTPATVPPTPVILYLHIPKAAGTTLGNWLYTQVREPEETCQENGQLRSGVFYYPAGFAAEPTAEHHAMVDRVLKRRDLRAVFGHFSFGLHRRIDRPSAYITMLRDPVDRVVSLYRFQRLLEQKVGSHDGVTLPQGMDLEGFIADPPYPEVHNGQTRRIAGVDVADERALEQARANLRTHFAVVGTTDRFDETVVLLSRRFGLSLETLYYPTNVNVTRQDTDDLQPSVVERIRRTQALDLALYEEARAVMDEQIARAGEGFSAEVARFRSRQRDWFKQVGGWDMPERVLPRQ